MGGQNHGLGMGLAPFFPAHSYGWQRSQSLPGHKAGYGFGHKLGPKALGLMVIEKHIAFIQTPGDAKSKRFAVHVTGVDHPRLGQRSESHHKRLTIQRIVDCFMPVQDLDGIGAGHITDSHTDDLVVIS